MLCKKRS